MTAGHARQGEGRECGTVGLDATCRMPAFLKVLVRVRLIAMSMKGSITRMKAAIFFDLNRTFILPLQLRVVPGDGQVRFGPGSAPHRSKIE